jgi:hypothetical protein
MKLYMIYIIALLFLTLAGCGVEVNGHKPSENPCIPNISVNDFTALNVPDSKGVVVKSRTILHLMNEEQSKTCSNAFARYSTANQSVPAAGSNAVSVTFSLNTGGFSVPALSNAVLSFGTLVVSTLNDNNLDTCGVGNNQHCGTAGIRIYTSGVGGAGFWNSVDSFGAPITAKLGANPAQTLGLGVANAVTMQTDSIPNNVHTEKLSDFAVTPSYLFSVDMTDAGSGSYASNVVVEYFLAP